MAILATGAVACVGAPEGAPSTEEETGSDVELLGAHDFGVQPDSALYLVADGSWVAKDGAPTNLEVPLQGGFVSVTVGDDGMVVESLALDLGDVEVGQSLVTPLGGTLTNIRLVLERPAAADGARDAHGAHGVAALDFRLEWTLALPDGREVELGSPEINDLPCEVDLSRDEDGRLWLDLSLAKEGDLMAIADAIDVTKISLVVEAAEIDTPPQVPSKDVAPGS
jgi:hypothetical protein